MVLTLTVWQKKKSGHPTRAAEGHLEDPSVESFEAAVSQLLSRVDPAALPFQIVASVGDSSRGFQLSPGWNDAEIKTELWQGYRKIMKTNG